MTGQFSSAAKQRGARVIARKAPHPGKAQIAWFQGLIGLIAGLLLILAATLADAQTFRFNNVVIEGNQRIGDMSTNEARSARDENFHQNA